MKIIDRGVKMNITYIKTFLREYIVTNSAAKLPTLTSIGYLTKRVVTIMADTTELKYPMIALFRSPIVYPYSADITLNIAAFMKETNPILPIKAC